jgi:hypothetical protein
MNYYQGIGKVIKDPKKLNEIEATRQYIAEPKMDGIWCAIIIDKSGIISEIKSRHEKTKITKGFKFFIGRKTNIPNSILIGELITTKNELHIFDIVRYKAKNTKNLDNEKRRTLIEKLNIYKNKISLVPRFKDSFLKHYNEIVKKGGEGLVLKKIGEGTKYIPNSRTPDWLKIKKFMTTDYVIMGFDTSTSSKYKGMIKAIRLGLYKNGTLKEVCKCGSMKENDRKFFTDNKEKLINKVIEVGGYDVFPSGATRHPFFIKLRPDLKPTDANIEKIKILREDEVLESLDLFLETKEEEDLLFDPERLLKYCLMLKKSKLGLIDRLVTEFDKLYNRTFSTVPSMENRRKKIHKILKNYYEAWAINPKDIKKIRFVYMVELEKLFDLKKVVYHENEKGKDKTPKRKEKPRRKGRGHLDESLSYSKARNI